MTFIRRWKNLLGNIVLIALGTVGLSACGDRWKEEVLLHDGSKIVVERSQNYGGRHELGQSPPIKEQELSFSLPGSGKRLNFKSEYGKDIGRANFKLLALHILNGMSYLITEPNLCLSYNKWGRPNPPYVIFKHDGEAWQRVPLQELPAEFKDINLLVETKSEAKQLPWLFPTPVDLIKKLNSSLTQPEFKTILRTPLAKGGKDCLEEVFNGKGTWLSIDWFSRQSNYEACLEICKREGFGPQHCPCGKLFSKE